MGLPVTLNVANLAVMAALIGAGCAMTYVVMRRSASKRQRETERQLNALAATVRNLEARLADSSEIPELQAAADFEIEAAAPAAKVTLPSNREQVTPETLVVIAAAATAFLGANVRIRSARMLTSLQSASSAWSQQGRVFVQASHNLRKGRG